ncbi:MAG: hypothetical protein OEZ43_05315 [Gammaproteobacteria bacterium]|nr:hypothetical protein [Gammaproteobacteria bacterium]
MKHWLEASEEALKRALEIAREKSFSLEDIYLLAPLLYAERYDLNDVSLLQKMGELNQEQYETDVSLDEESRGYYKFHLVSSFLYCYVVHEKIDEFKYDEVMEYVNANMDLFD